jgi:hypothetical protein
MIAGAWQVRLEVEGARGPATISVPVSALSERVASMDRQTGLVLIGLGALLILGVVGIAGAAWTQASLAPGEKARGKGLWRIRAIAAAVALALVFLGGRWWDNEARAYADSLYRPLDARVAQSGDRLTLSLVHSGWYQPETLDDFIDDHGYPMHLFLVKPDTTEIAHLHPVTSAPGKFGFVLPPGLSGDYEVFGDLVHKNGLPETVRTKVTLQKREAPSSGNLDDAVARALPSEPKSTVPVGNGWTVHFEPTGPIVAGKPLQLQFKIIDESGNPAKNIRPYLGMPAHLILVHEDLSVFAHLHPGGTVPPATLALTNAVRETTQHGEEKRHSEVTFPFGLPKPGRYRAVLQFRDLKEIRSAVFDFSVL